MTTKLHLTAAPPPRHGIHDSPPAGLTSTRLAPRASGNYLLAALPAEACQHCLSQLEYVPMRLGQTLYQSGSSLTHVYFPTTAIASQYYLCANGASAVTAFIGNESAVGLAMFIGGGSRSSSASVICAGHGYRLRTQVMKDEFNRGGALLYLFMEHTLALMTQITQTAACNRFHTIDQQLARWLLTSLDRTDSTELAMTHELLATALGVRREGITAAALKLRSAGIIRYARGRITVLERAALERMSCECYAVVRAEYERLGPDWVAKQAAERTPTAAANDQTSRSASSYCAKRAG